MRSLNILTMDETCKVLRMGRTKLSKILNTDPTFPAVYDGKWFIFGNRLEEWMIEKKRREMTVEKGMELNHE